jgi:putative flippase GtrA
LKVLGGQFAGFAVVGTINTILSFLLYQIFYLWVSYWLAYTLVFIASYAFMLLANAGFVFRTQINARSAFYYLMVYVLNYTIGLAIITALIEWLHVPAQMAPIGAFGFLVLFNFLGTRFAIGVRS